MAKSLQVNLQLNTAQAQSALKQLQAQANQIGKSSGSGGGGSGSSGGTRSGSGGGGAGELISGKLAGFAAAAAALSIAALGSEFNKLGSRARELAATAGTASSQLGQLRSSIEQAGIRTDINATSPAVVGFEKFKQDVGTNIGDALTHLLDGKPDRDKALQQKFSDGLGQGNEDWRRLKEQGVDLEQDIGIARQAQQVKWQRAERDFKQSRLEWETQVGNQRFDLQKQASRQQFDNQIAVQKFEENFANKQSQKAYDLSRQFAAQNFAISQGRAAQDFAISQGRNSQDFSISQGRNVQDYGISKARSREDRRDQLTDMALGGANGLDYFRAARDYNKSQRRFDQDFSLSQGRATQDFTLGQGRAAQDYNLNRQRSGQDFTQQNREAAASHQLELEGQEYARKYEGLELQTQINRSTQDLDISFQRLDQQIGFQLTRFGNQASDMAYDKNLDQSNFALQTSRQRRNFGYAQADFAGAARAKDPLGAAGLGSRDSAFAAALATNAQQSGQTDLFKQVNDSAFNSNNSAGAKIGDAIRSIMDFAKDPLGYMNQQGADLQKKFEQGKAKYAAEHPDLAAMYGYGGGPGGGSGGGGASTAAAAPSIIIQTGGNTYALDPGLSISIQAYVDDQDKKTQEAITDMIKRYYSG